MSMERLSKIAQVPHVARPRGIANARNEKASLALVGGSQWDLALWVSWCYKEKQKRVSSSRIALIIFRIVFVALWSGFSRRARPDCSARTV